MATIHTRATLDRELEEIQAEVHRLGVTVDRAIDRSIGALKRLDQVEARAIAREDAQINDKRFETEERAIRLIATQQPIASDLRTIIAVLHIVVELERMADYAAGIAKIVLMH